MKTILEIVVGSTAHGITSKDKLEDLDLMSVVLEDPKHTLGFHHEDTWVHRSKPEGVRSEAGDVDHTAYGLRKFMTLALKNNPTILMSFFVHPDHIRQITDEGVGLRGFHDKIVSRQCYDSFRGYMRQQHLRLLGQAGQKRNTRPELVEAYGYDTKYAAHIVRLGLQGEELLREGRITLPMRDAPRDLCTRIRNGERTLEEVSEIIVAVEKRLTDAYVATKLPETPDKFFMQDWMLKTYLNYWRTC